MNQLIEAQPPFGQSHILQNSVVVFSKNYLPLARINIKRAIALLITGQAESLTYSPEFSASGFGGVCQLESANSSTELQKGLKYRSSLASERGMLFNLGKPYTNAGFWMYKVNLPLDIIFLNQGMQQKSSWNDGI